MEIKCPFKARDGVNFRLVKAIAGHDGVLTSTKGDVFIKPATDAEIHFYETIHSSYPELAKLCPTYYGGLKNMAEEITVEEAAEPVLNKATIPDGGHHKQGEPLSAHDQDKEEKSTKIPALGGVALESLDHGFRRANMLDIKLGIDLYDNDAKLEKKRRFTKVTSTSTNKTFGFRFAGMKVWHGHDVVLDVDQVRKDMKKDPLPETYYDEHAFFNYSGEYGKKLKDDQVLDAFRTFLFEPRALVDADLGRYVAQKFLEEVEKMKNVLEKIVSRMYSASILFVYEGDGKWLREEIEEQKRLDAGGKTQPLPPKRRKQRDIDADDDEEDQMWEPLIFKCKLIDFAHAKIGEDAVEHQGFDPEDTEETHKAKIEMQKPAKGPDENMLTGVRSVAKLLKQVTEEGALTNGHNANKA